MDIVTHICPNCGANIQENKSRNTCKYCGTQITKDIFTNYYASPKSIRIISVLIIIFLSISIGGFTSYHFILKHFQMYKEAMQLFRNNDYVESKIMFEQIPQIFHPDQIIVHCDYEIANRKLKDEDYNMAIEMFATLGNYQNSQELLLESKYLLAKTYIQKNSSTNIEMNEAIDILIGLNNYKDSYVLVKECKYRITINNISKLDASLEELEEAVKYLIELNGFSDTQDYLVETKFRLARAYYYLGRFNQSFEIFNEISEYEKSEPYIKPLIVLLKFQGTWMSEIRGHSCVIFGWFCTESINTNDKKDTENYAYQLKNETLQYDNYTYTLIDKNTLSRFDSASNTKLTYSKSK